MATAFKKDKGWKRLQKMLDPKKSGRIMSKHLQRATRLNGKIAEKQIRDTIKAGSYTSNAELTQAIKGEDKPLIGVDAGAQLFGGITSKMMDDTTLFVGILKTAGIYNVAVALHEGVSITVTPAMRGLFFILWQASTGAIDRSKLTGRAAELFALKPGGWLPLKPSTTFIIIPARRFIEQAFADKSVRKKSKANWLAATKAAFAELRASS